MDRRRLRPQQLPALVATVALLAAVGCGGSGGEAPDDADSKAAGSAPAYDGPLVDPEVAIISVEGMGEMVVELLPGKAPKTVENFKKLAREGFYDGIVFHRVIDGFMAQTGAFTPDMKQRRGNATIKNEWQNGLSNARGTLAMARLGNQPDSASNQFFINLVDNGFLDQPRDGAGYAVFGKVVEGMDVVDSIRGVQTTTKAGHADVPVEPIVVESAARTEQ